MKMTIIDIINDTDLPPSQKQRLLDLVHDRSLNTLVESVHGNAKAHGWWENKREFGTLLMLCVTELSEAFEEYRTNKPPIYYAEGKPEGIAIELIDVVLRIMDIFGHEGWDFQNALEIKHEYNVTRPYKHGGKKV